MEKDLTVEMKWYQKKRLTEEEVSEYNRKYTKHYSKLTKLRYDIAHKIFFYRKEKHKSIKYLEISNLFAELEKEYLVNYLYSYSRENKEEAIIHQRKNADGVISSVISRLEKHERRKKKEEEYRKNNPDWNKPSKLNRNYGDAESDIMNSFGNDTKDYFGF